jgi:hypothetical protein
VGEISTKWPIQDRTVTVSEITMRVHQVYTRSQRYGSNINQRAYTGGSKYSKLKWYKMNLFKAGVDVLKLLLPVFTNAGQSSDMGVYCLSLQMLVRGRTWGSIACLYKCWSELGHGGLLSGFTNGGQSPDTGVYCPVCRIFHL